MYRGGSKKCLDRKLPKTRRNEQKIKRGELSKVSMNILKLFISLLFNIEVQYLLMFNVEVIILEFL